MRMIERIRDFEVICLSAKVNKGEKFANWVSDAISYYATTGRSSLDFDKAFIALTDKQMEELITYCTKRDLSTEGIIKSVKTFLKRHSKITQ